MVSRYEQLNPFNPPDPFRRQRYHRKPAPTPLEPKTPEVGKVFSFSFTSLFAFVSIFSVLAICIMAFDYMEATGHEKTPVSCRPGWFPSLEIYQIHREMYVMTEQRKAEINALAKDFLALEIPEIPEPSKFTVTSSLPLKEMGLDFGGDLANMVTLAADLQHIGYILFIADQGFSVLKQWSHHLYKTHLKDSARSAGAVRSAVGRRVDISIYHLTEIKQKCSDPKINLKKTEDCEQKIKANLGYVYHTALAYPVSDYTLAPDMFIGILDDFVGFAHLDGSQPTEHKYEQLGDIDFWINKIASLPQDLQPPGNIGFTAIQLVQYHQAIKAAVKTSERISDTMQSLREKQRLNHTWLGKTKKSILIKGDVVETIDEIIRIYEQQFDHVLSAVEESRAKERKTLHDILIYHSDIDSYSNLPEIGS